VLKISRTKSQQIFYYALAVETSKENARAPGGGGGGGRGGGGQLASYNPNSSMGMGNISEASISLGMGANSMANQSMANQSMSMTNMSMAENFNPNMSMGNALTEYKSLPVNSLMDYSSWS
jgi:hypothetical protein